MARFGDLPLTPTAFLDRARGVYPDVVAWRGTGGERTYAEVGDRCERLAGALRELGVRPGDRVSVLAPNTDLAFETHFAVPWAGAVLNMLNTRLSATELAYIVDHAGSRLLLVDHELAPVADDIRTAGADVEVVRTGAGTDFAALVATAHPLRSAVDDERSLLSLNYTSGTTGRPKGVMYSHRGAYLQALAMAAQTGMGAGTVFLWTLPMFHCNGWCFPWAVTAIGGAHIELRRVEPEAIWTAIREHGVTHFNAAPTVLSALAASPSAAPVSFPIRVATGGAPPSPALLGRLEELGIVVTHLYGLTETYGPAVICERQPAWDEADAETRSRFVARQGVANLVGLPVRVVDDEGRDVPADGTSLGEVVLRGNNVMLGYYRDQEATDLADADGWFRTGDLGVLHPDRSLELRDRAKDVIVSGGENIASIEVEQVLAAHDAVLECAVVAAPDDTWGEVPVAFVTLHDGRCADADELIAWTKARLARFKAPKAVHFGMLPKTATGKIQKFALRESLWSGRERRIG